MKTNNIAGGFLLADENIPVLFSMLQEAEAAMLKARENFAAASARYEALKEATNLLVPADTRIRLAEREVNPAKPPSKPGSRQPAVKRTPPRATTDSTAPGTEAPPSHPTAA